MAVLALTYRVLTVEIVELCALLDDGVDREEAIRRAISEGQDEELGQGEELGQDEDFEDADPIVLAGTLREVAATYAALKLCDVFELRDRLLDCNAPTVVVDWEKWRGLPYWTLSEAAALSLGKDPDHLAAADLDGDRRLPTLRAFQERHERLRRALELGLVGEGDAVIPARLAAWLKDAALGQVLAGTSPPNDKEISIPPRAEGPTEPPPKTERPSKGTSNTTTRGDMPRTGLVRLNQILAPAGPLPVSKSTFWAKVKDGTFPQSVRLGRATAWRAEEIWALVDEQGQKPSKKR